MGRDWVWRWEEGPGLVLLASSCSLGEAGAASVTVLELGPGSVFVFCWIIQSARWCSSVAPLAASSSGSRKCESRLRWELGNTAAEEAEVTVPAGLEETEVEVTEGEAGQEEAEVSLGGSGTLNTASSLEAVGGGGVDSVAARLAYRGCEVREAMLTYRGWLEEGEGVL